MEKEHWYKKHVEISSKLPITVVHLFKTEAEGLAEFHIKPDFHCLYVRRKGRALIFNGGKRQTLHEGQGLLLKKDHNYHFKENVMIDGGGWMILFNGYSCERILRYLEIDFFSVFDVDMDQLQRMEIDIYRCMYAHKQDFYKASLIFQEFLHSISPLTKDDEIIDIRMCEVDKYINRHYCENIALEELAKIYGTSISYFTRAYKSVHSIPPMQNVRKLRHERAKYLLEQTEKKIYDISHECGFDNCDYFCAVFKKTEGVTPAQYRRERQLNML